MVREHVLKDPQAEPAKRVGRVVLESTTHMFDLGKVSNKRHAMQQYFAKL